MSGRGDGGTPVGPPRIPSKCEELGARVTLTSPNPKVLKKMKVGDELSVALEGGKGPVVVVTGGGEVAGSIVSAITVHLIRCISDGNNYVAKVRSINGGMCEVDVRWESAK